MYDTVDVTLYKKDAMDEDFVSKVGAVANNIYKTENESGSIIGYCGEVEGLKIRFNELRIKICGNSINKWHLGDNLQTMGRKDIQQAFEKLSDKLRLPMGKSRVTRFDVAQNMIMKNPVETYYSYLGKMKYSERAQIGNGLYYTNKRWQLCFYDKLRELESRGRGKSIPDLFVGRNVLRYELRYKKNVGNQFGCKYLTAEQLYDKQFYIRILDNWRNMYNEIQKINDTVMNWEAVKGVKDMNTMGMLCLIEQYGGINKILSQIADAQKKGGLTSKQAYDIRRALNKAMEVNSGFTVVSDDVKELNRKVNEAVRFYR